MTTIAQQKNINQYTESWNYDSDEEFYTQQVPKTAAQLKADAEKAAAIQVQRTAEKAANDEQDRKDVLAIAPKLKWIEEAKRDAFMNRSITTPTEESSYEEFPVLGAAPKPKKQKLTQTKEAHRGSKKTKLFIAGKSYREERGVNHDPEVKRTAAFGVLADKEGLEKQLTKTRMCMSVGGKNKCRHGEKCRFAHTLEELKISTCFFKDECRFVKFVDDDKCVDSGSKKCAHKHPSESKENFLSRTGLDLYKAKVEKPVEIPKVIEIPKFSADQLEKMEAAEKERVTQSMSKPCAWANALKPKSKTTTPRKSRWGPPVCPGAPVKVPNNIPIEDAPMKVAEEKETILRVPKDLALAMLEVAIKSGKTNIRLEII